MSTAHHHLAAALAAMRWSLEPGRFALCGFPGEPAPEDLGLVARSAPAALVREAGQTTLLVPEASLEAVLARHPGARCERGRAWIRFEAPMAWDLVGFLAHVSARLAEAGVPVGVVASFDRDHLFVGEEHLGRSCAVLTALFGPPLEPGR